MSFNAGSINSVLGLDIDPFARGMLRAEGIMGIFPTTVTNFLVNPMLGVVGVAGEVTNALVGMATRGIQSAAAMEQNAIAFEVMLGSADKAKQLMKDIKDFAAETPFEQAELVEATRKLIAFGFGGDEALGKLRQLGDLSAALQIPLRDLADIYGKARVSGRLFAEDINQLSGRGIPIVTELAKVFGVAESEVRDLVNEGRVGFPELEKAIANMTGEGGMFADMMKRQSDSLTGLYSTLKDAWSDVERQFGEALVKGADGKSILKDITAEIDKLKPAIVDFGMSLANAFGNALPYVRELMGWAENVLHMMGLLDRYRAAGSPLQGADDGSLVSNYSKTSIDLKRMQQMYAEQSAAAITGFASATHMTSNSFAGGFGLEWIDKELKKDTEKAIEEFEKTAQLIDREKATLDDLVKRSAAGEAIDDKQFDQVKKRLGELIQFADKFRELNDRARSGAAISNLVPQHDVDLLESRSKNLKAFIAQSTAEIDRLRELDRRAQADAKMRAAAAGSTDAPATGGSTPAAASADAAAKQKAKERELEQIEAARKAAMQRAAELDFRAENLRIEREQGASNARLAIFDRETQFKSMQIENMTELWAYQMLRLEERAALSARIRQELEAETTRVLKQEAEQQKRDAEQAQAENSRRLNDYLGFIDRNASIYSKGELSGKFDPLQSDESVRRTMAGIKRDYDDMIGDAVRRGNQREARRLRSEKGDVLGELNDIVGDRVNTAVGRGAALPPIHVTVGQTVDTQALIRAIGERFKSLIQEEVGKVATAIEIAAIARTARENM